MSYKPKVITDLAARYTAGLGYAPSVPLLKPSEGIPGSQYAPAGNLQVYKSLELNQTFEDFNISGYGFDFQFSSKPLIQSGQLGNIFAPPPLITYRKVKRLVITEVNGSDAEVVERFNNGAYEIVMDGIIVDMENHVFPLSKLEQLRKLFDTNEVFDVSGDIFNALDIQSIYFMEFTPSGVQAYQDTIRFTLVCRSIKPVEFFLNNEQ